MRVEPFSSLAIKLQSGKWDLPDRLFHSVSLAWNLSLNNVSDVKELIPEFFYFPDFLRNCNHYDLGVKQEVECVCEIPARVYITHLWIQSAKNARTIKVLYLCCYLYVGRLSCRRCYFAAMGLFSRRICAHKSCGWLALLLFLLQCFRGLFVSMPIGTRKRICICTPT